MKLEVSYHPSARQRRFHDSDADDILYGGSAGGGKSCAVVIDALVKACEHPGAYIYCFRRTYTELEDTLISEAKRWYPPDLGKWVMGPPPTFYLPNGSEIRFRHCQYDSDIEKYQSAQMSGLYIDEAGHFNFKKYDYLSTRVRVPKSQGYKPQVKLTANPGGEGHGWIKSKYINGAVPDEIKRIITHSEFLGKDFEQSVQFIPAKLSDNPHLGDYYAMRLEGRGEALKRALLFGDWDIFDGQAFTEWRNKPEHYDDHEMTHVINPFQIPRHWKIFRSYDFGYSAPYSVLWWAIGDETVNNRIYLICELYGANAKEFNVGLRQTAAEQAALIRKIETTPQYINFKDTNGVDQQVVINMGAHGFIDGIADPAIWDNSAGTNTCIGEMMAKQHVYFRDARYDPEAKRNVVNNRLQGKQIIHELLKFQDDNKPLLQVFSTCPNLIKHIPELVNDPDVPEDVLSEKTEDHDYDAMRYMATIKRPQITQKKQLQLRKEVPDADPLDQEPKMLKMYGR